MNTIFYLIKFSYLTAFIVFQINRIKHPTVKQKEQLPNIVFILCDDLRADAVGYSGNSIIQTPNIDKLASNGVIFKKAYVTSSICSVSRASILTGQYARKHNIWGFSKDFSPKQLSETYPLILKKAGYSIGFVGKYGIGSKAPEAAYDYWAGFNGQGSYKQKDKNKNPIHLTAKIGSQAIEFLNQQKNTSNPFYLSISFKAPHVEGDPGYFLPDDQFEFLYESDHIPIPITSQPKFQNHFPKIFTSNNVARNRWLSRFSNPDLQQENIKKYYRLISGIDHQVGNLLKTLKDNNQDRNTIVIFTSDNGFYLGEYGFAGKWYGSEASIRVPLFITDLNKPRKEPLFKDEMVLNIDLAPTILDYAGISPSSNMQGNSIVPLTENKKILWREQFFYEHLWESNKAYFIPSTEGVVSKNMKYMTYFINNQSDQVIFEELYDLDNDPYETVNQALNLSYKKDKEILKKTLNEFKVNLTN